VAGAGRHGTLALAAGERRALRTTAALLLLTLVPGPAWAQAAPAVRIRTIPSIPFRGSVVMLEVVAAPDTSRESALLGVSGDAAGEPLHLERSADRFAGMMGIPLEGGDSLEVLLRLERPGRIDTTRVSLAVRQPSYATERLTVDPALAQPDSAARARIADELAQSREVSLRSHETPRLWRSFLRPRPSRITSRYGTARAYNGLVTSRHLGTDFAGRTGAPVRAAARGVVALVADFYLAGHAIYLDHGAGLTTGYFHLSRTDVVAGDTVEAGQIIGAVGRSGRVTGPHLHWIARYGTITVDPMSMLRVGQADRRAGGP
jgi:hypothetical protein